MFQNMFRHRLCGNDSSFWYLCEMAGSKANVAGAAKRIDKFEDSFYSNVASGIADLKEEFGGTERNPWGRYECAIYHDLKHAGVWNEVRHGDSEAAYQLQLRGLDHVLKNSSRAHPSAVWAGEVDPVRDPPMS